MTTETEWTTLATETPEPWDGKPGESLQGTFEGIELIQPDDGSESFRYALIRETDGGTLYRFSARKVLKALDGANSGDLVRLVYIKDVDMGAGRNPMKDFMIQRRPQ